MSSVRENKRDALEQKKRLNESRRETRLHYGFGVNPAKTMKVCTECGTVCKATENFCIECGARLPVKNLYELSIEDAVRCPHCGTILKGNEDFCPICGKGLRTAG